MFSKSKKEIVEAFIADARGMTIKEIKKITATRLLIIIATKSLGRLVAGGMTAALGACFMHYIGMLAMQFPGEIVWEPGIVFVSCLIAAVAGIAAFLILFRLLSLFPDLEVLRLAAAIVMAIAVTVMHYTGMVAAEFRYDPNISHPRLGDASVHDNMAFYGALVASNIFLWLMIIFLLGDVRKMMNEKNRHLAEADTLLRRMAEENANNKFSNNIHSYLSHRSIQCSRENSICSVNTANWQHHGGGGGGGSINVTSPTTAASHHKSDPIALTSSTFMHNRVVPLVVGVESIKEEERDVDLLSTKIIPSKQTMLSLPMNVASSDAAEGDSPRDATMTLGFSFSGVSGENKADENV